MSDTAWAWPTPLLHRVLPGHGARNPALLRAMKQARAASPTPDAVPWVSADDVHLRARARGGSSAVRELLRLCAGAVHQVARDANARAWEGIDDNAVSVEIVGAWWQVTNGFGRHDVHNHGNCSWSGVTYIDVDPDAARTTHPVLGAENGVTRLYGPHLPRLGGAAMDLGAAWMQDVHLDVAPAPGAVVVWPSFLLHQQLPYDGARDRVVLAFNARVVGPPAHQRPFRMG